MPTLAEKRQISKRGLAENGRRRESFGWIKAVSVVYKAGIFPDREAALQFLFTGATAEDIREFRRAFGHDPLN